MKPVLTRLSALGIAAALLYGCGLITEVCTQELRTVISPSDTTVSSGDSFDIEAYGTSCGGREILTLDITWESTDSNVLSVTDDGRVLASGTGTAFVHGVDHSRWSAGGLDVRVTVVE